MSHAQTDICNVSHYHEFSFMEEERVANDDLIRHLLQPQGNDSLSFPPGKDAASPLFMDRLLLEVKERQREGGARPALLSTDDRDESPEQGALPPIVMMRDLDEERLQAFLQAERNHTHQEDDEHAFSVDNKANGAHYTHAVERLYHHSRLYGNVSEVNRLAFVRYLIKNVYRIATHRYTQRADRRVSHQQDESGEPTDEIVVRTETQDEYWRRMALLYIYQGPQEETTPLPDESFTRSVVDSFASEDAAYHGNKPPLFSDNEEEEDTPEERNFSANNKSTNVKRTRHHKTDYIPIEKHDPFYLIDVGNLVRRMSLWRQYFPHVRPFFAVKCNPNPIFIHLLFALGAGFDCASKEEVNLVLNTINHNEAWSQAVRDDTDYKAFKRLRLSPEEDIVFANPCKQVGDILFAKEKRVNFFTFDNEEELRKIAKCYPDAKLIIRIKTNDQNAVCAFSTKFGSTVHSNQAHNRNTAKTLLLLAKELGLEIYGVSFHVGSGNGDVQAYVSALHDAHAVFAMAAEIGFNLTVLDIGGGYPGLSEGGDRVLAAIAAAMNPVLEELFIKEGVHVLSEPGRFFTASTHALAVNVFASRTIPLAERENKAVVEKLRASDVPESVLRRLGVMGEYKNGKKADESTPAVPVLEEHQFYLNDGLYNSFNCILFDHAAPRLFVLPSDERWSLPAEPPVENDPTREEEEGETAPVTQRPAPLQLTTLFGPTCDSMDCILKQSLFPPLHIGDWLLAPDMGSYTVAAGCAFNGFATRRREYICSLDLDL